MKKIYTVALLILMHLLPFLCFAQGGIWTWMHGSKFTGSAGNYGTKGIAAATNEPPARYEPCYWTDLQGNFWLFGGIMNSSTGLGNDLWKYDVSTNMWTWMSGPNVNASTNPPGVSGTKGIPSVNNYPSERGYGANCWTDNNGDLWLFAGAGGYDDLWRYHIPTNEWTWIKGQVGGSPTAVYGTQGIPSSANTPGMWQEVKSGWVDAANNLWMFGGNYSNTLWKYSIATNEWTWVRGGTVMYAPGNYGTYQVEAAANEPTSRYSYTRWQDVTGNMYIFGGAQQASGGFSGGFVNDVWRYRPGTGNWTWIGGTNIPNDTGKYPPQYCKFYDAYYPPARYENQTPFFAKSCANAFWTFGGIGPHGMYNDLWLYSADSLKWCWVSGTNKTNDTGSYTALGVPSITNIPRARGGQCMWLDANHNIWMFGGYGPYYKLCNDLMRFQVDPSCIPMQLIAGSDVITADTTICRGERVTRTFNHPIIQYSPNTYVSHNADSSVLSFSPPVTTAYQVVITEGTCHPADTLKLTIHVQPRDTVKLSPPKSIKLCVGDSTSMSVKPGWIVNVFPSYKVDYLSTGGSQIIFYPDVTTRYTVVARNNDPCAISPDTISFTITNDGITQHAPPVTDTILCKGDTAFYHLPANPSVG